MLLDSETAPLSNIFLFFLLVKSLTLFQLHVSFLCPLTEDILRTADIVGLCSSELFKM